MTSLITLNVCEVRVQQTRIKVIIYNIGTILIAQKKLKTTIISNLKRTIRVCRLKLQSNQAAYIYYIHIAV